MKSKLYRVILGIVLVVAIFLSHSQVVRAAGDDEDWPEVPGHYDQPYTFRSYGNVTVTSVSNVFIYPDGTVSYFLNNFSNELCIGYFVLSFDPGYSYDGHMQVMLDIPYVYPNTVNLIRSSCSLSLSCITTTGDGWVTYGDSSYSYDTNSFTIHASLNLNNFSVSTGTVVTFPINCLLFGQTAAESLKTSGSAVSLYPGTASSWVNDMWEAAQAFDGSTTQYYLYEQTKIIEKNHSEQMEQQISIAQQEMKQQQEIAAAQASQSAEQHENLVNGYDNTANNAMLQDKGNQLAAYEASQDAAFDSGQKYVTDFSSQYSTSAFTSLSPSFILLSGWFNRLWSGLGNFTSILTVALVLCVAGYILKIKH